MTGILGNIVMTQLSFSEIQAELANLTILLNLSNFPAEFA